MDDQKEITTLEDVLGCVEKSGMNATRRRDVISAIKRCCEMAGTAPRNAPVAAPQLRTLLAKIPPAAHGVSAKTYANLRSLLTSALQLAGIIDDLNRGAARRDPAWSLLMRAVVDDKRLSNGLAAFANWCATRAISPESVNDATVQSFLHWLEHKTLYPKPRDLVRRIPNIWNEAREKFEIWPANELTVLSFRSPSKHLKWAHLSPSFQREAEAYLAMRAAPDLFDERLNAPRRPLAATTLRQQREHLRLAASVLNKNGNTREINSLADLIDPEAFKSILRHYYEQAGSVANAFVVSLSTTLLQVARYHVCADEGELKRLKRIASKLPAVPFDLTTKNRSLLRQLESKRLRARLLFLPEQLLAEVAKNLKAGRVQFVEAQVAIAVDILLAIPLRPQNLTSLNWHDHFNEPSGFKGSLLLHIAAQHTKTKRHDITAEIPDYVAHRLRWYQRHVLPRLNAALDGYLFVTERGCKKSQETLSQQITETIARRVGVHMTPHQFRHFGATSYLEEFPEDFETARSLLGHAWSKTTRIYAGSSTRRASKAYNKFVVEQREALRFRRSIKKCGRV